MLTKIKKMLGFGELVDDARKGNMSRRGFLQAAVAMGVGSEEAHSALHRRVYSAPKLVTMNAVQPVHMFYHANPWNNPWGMVDVVDVVGELAAVMSVVKLPLFQASPEAIRPRRGGEVPGRQ